MFHLLPFGSLNGRNKRATERLVKSEKDYMKKI